MVSPSLSFGEGFSVGLSEGSAEKHGFIRVPPRTLTALRYKPLPSSQDDFPSGRRPERVWCLAIHIGDA